MFSLLSCFERKPNNEDCTFFLWHCYYQLEFCDWEWWTQFSIVSVIFWLKMCLSHGKVMSKVCMSKRNFYLSWTIGHGFWCTLIAVNNSNDDNNKRYKRSVSKEKGNVEPCLVKCFNLISFRYSFKREKNPQPQQNSTKCWKITKILSCKTSLARPSNTVTKTKRGRWWAMMAYAPKSWTIVELKMWWEWPWLTRNFTRPYWVQSNFWPQLSYN